MMPIVIRVKLQVSLSEKLNNIGRICGAQKFMDETREMCCVDGKVKSDVSNSPHKSLLSLFSGISVDSKYLMQNIQKHNSTF